jgi:hypothetical protein
MFMSWVPAKKAHDSAQSRFTRDSTAIIKNRRVSTDLTGFQPGTEGPKHPPLCQVRDFQVNEPDKSEKWDWFIWEKFPENLFLSLKNILAQGFHNIPSCYNSEEA